MKEINEAIAAFKKELTSDDYRVDWLVKSLIKAKETASKELDTVLYNVLTWPVTVDKYEAYLNEFLRWVPEQYGEAWKAPGEYDQNQEVYDRICHYYWLIDQEVIPPGESTPKRLQNDPWFSKYLVYWAKEWGRFLDTTDSITGESLK